MSLTYDKVQAHLDRLKLTPVAELLDPLCEQASKEEISYLEFLERLLEAEASGRAERRLVAKTRLAHFPFVKTLADFDFTFQPSSTANRSRSWPPCARRTDWATVFAKLRHPTLLILDEMGYLPLDQVATSFLFQLVSQRYTKGSIIVTSNKSYVEWGAVFGDEVAAAAILDRLLYHSTAVNIRGESYRLKDKKRAGVFSTPPPAKSV